MVIQWPAKRTDCLAEDFSTVQNHAFVYRDNTTKGSTSVTQMSNACIRLFNIFFGKKKIKIKPTILSTDSLTF